LPLSMTISSGWRRCGPESAVCGSSITGSAQATAVGLAGVSAKQVRKCLPGRAGSLPAASAAYQHPTLTTIPPNDPKNCFADRNQSFSLQCGEKSGLGAGARECSPRWTAPGRGLSARPLIVLDLSPSGSDLAGERPPNLLDHEEGVARGQRSVNLTTPSPQPSM
jgi:hypothetical protein